MKKNMRYIPFKTKNKNNITKHKMKNIGASVSEVLTQEKKEAEVEKVEEEGGEGEGEEEEEYHQMENEVIFCLEEAPEFQISAVAEWGENSRGDMVVGVDTYFRHITSGQRCESVRDCFTGWSECDEHSTEMWETLCERIENYGNLEQTICDEKRVVLYRT